MMNPVEGGGIALDLRAELGRREHQRRQGEIRRRCDDYNGEYQISRTFDRDGFSINLRGRPDAVYREGEYTVVEEIKTIATDAQTFDRCSLDSFPNFKSQLDIYCHLLHLTGTERVLARLYIVNIADGSERTLDYQPDFELVGRVLGIVFARLVADIERLKQRRWNLSASTEMLNFPYTSLRAHQGAMLDEVSAAVESGGRLMLSAPTGSGKTAGVLFPALVESFKLGRKVFFATARTTQRHVVYDFVGRLKQNGAPFSALFMTARAKMCPLREEICLWEECSYLVDFQSRFDRCGLLKEMDEGAVMTGEGIAERTAPLKLCPFAVSLKLAEVADLLVGDFNYAFDPSVALRGVFSDGGSADFTLIIDEAHNMPGRIRDRYSPSLYADEVQELLAKLRGKSFSGETFSDLISFLNSLLKMINRMSLLEEKLELNMEEIQSLHAASDRLAMDYFLHLTKFGAAEPDDPIIGFLKSFGWFCRVAEMGPEGFAYYYHPEEKRLGIHCLDSGNVIRGTVDSFHSIIAMSATLHPPEFFRCMLGLNESTEVLNLPNPFPSENRLITIVPTVSTRYNVRNQFHRPIAQILDLIYEVHPGRYFCFFPSFGYTQAVERFLNVPYLAQHAGMAEHQRDSFLAEVSQGDDRFFLGVMGGIFAEGVDFPGQLDGVVIIGPGLPLFCPETELQREYFQAAYDKGFEYAYLYPGMNRVIQAAGRLIRSENDRGVIVLVGARFNQEPYRSLIPAEWYVEHPSELVTTDLEDTLSRFWER